MAFKNTAPTKRGRNNAGQDTGPLYYATVPRKGNLYGLQLKLFMRPSLMDRAGLCPGDRVSLEVDKDEGLGRLVKAAQLGWVINPVVHGASVYVTHIAWNPSQGFPRVTSVTGLNVLLVEPGSIIFQMPGVIHE